MNLTNKTTAFFSPHPDGEDIPEFGKDNLWFFKKNKINGFLTDK